MTKRLVFLRHGRTEWNHQGRWQGQTDVDLDDVGREQARAVAPALAGFAAIWSSDLKRAYETATIVAGSREVVTDVRLRERNLGEAQGLLGTEARERFADVPNPMDVTSPLPTIPGAETYADVERRGTAAARDLLSSLVSGEAALIASHGGLIRATLGGLLDWAPSVVHDMKGLGNCHIAEVEQASSGRLRLVSYGALPISHS